ncbi:MAG: putative PEP-binding protein, partial [Candidatus Nanopelagicales bacterium]
ADEALEFSNLARQYGIKKVGVMIETPSAALVSDQILEIVDFASFGTNDLTQYVMAADRLDSRLSDLTNSWHPAVLRIIQIVGRNAQNKPLGVCGEAAADPLLAAVLVGLGVNSLSMASNSIAEVKSFIATQDLAKCQTVAQEVLKTKNAIEAKNLAIKLFT